jgi:hypothetical protein
MPGVGRAPTPQKPARILKPFSEVPPSENDRPRMGSAPSGPCAWCDAPSETRYGVTVDEKTWPLCNACGEMNHPTYAEIRAKIRAGLGLANVSTFYDNRPRVGRVGKGCCGACGTEGPKGECPACGGEIK